MKGGGAMPEAQEADSGLEPARTLPLRSPLNPTAIDRDTGPFLCRKSLVYNSRNKFEAWIKKQPGVKLDKGSIDKLNGAIRGYIHDDSTRKGILGACGIPDEASAPRDAVNLNNLDDWYEFHQAVLK